MKIVLSRRLVIVIGVLTIALTASAAFGFWSAITGSGGTGSAAVGRVRNPLTITQSTPNPQNALSPGASVPISGTISNSNPVSLFVNSVTVSIASVTPTTGNTCTPSNFTIQNSTMVPGGGSGASVPANGTLAFSGATLQMIDTNQNQDGCQGATVNLSYSIP